jgi:hypothetical protein
VHSGKVAKDCKFRDWIGPFYWDDGKHTRSKGQRCNWGYIVVGITPSHLVAAHFEMRTAHEDISP